MEEKRKREKDREVGEREGEGYCASKGQTNAWEKNERWRRRLSGREEQGARRKDRERSLVT